MKILRIYIDGGARGNPGPAAAGVYIVDEMSKPVHAIRRFLGFATNNEAEYRALLLAYGWLFEYKHELDCQFFDIMAFLYQINCP